LIVSKNELLASLSVKFGFKLISLFKIVAFKVNKCPFTTFAKSSFGFFGLFDFYLRNISGETIMLGVRIVIPTFSKCNSWNFFIYDFDLLFNWCRFALATSLN